MLTYHQFEKEVYDWFIRKHKDDNSFTFSLRKNANKEARRDYFIGTEKSKYFGTSFWYIPVGFPGSSGDLFDVIFMLDPNGYKYHFEFSQTRKPADEQNKIALELIKALKEPVKKIFDLKSESSVDAKMETYKSQPVQENYNDLDILLKDLNNDLSKLLPLIDNAISDLKKTHPKFIAHRITKEEFDEMQNGLIKRFEKYPDTENEGDKIDAPDLVDRNRNKDSIEATDPLNQILFGPPGTGKTFNTVNRALEIIGLKTEGKSRTEIKASFDSALIKDWESTDGRIAFITFHQSMSYEDFIEGIKPLPPEKVEDQVKYDIVDGIFKKLCKRAKESEKQPNNIDNIGENFDEVYEKFINDVRNKDSITLRTKAENSPYTLQINKEGSCVAIANTEKKSKRVIKKSTVYNFLLDDTIYQDSSYALPIVDYLKENYVINTNPKKEGPKNYVLIIDEINRGNVSQIFGELITLIENDKRLGEPEELESILPYSKEKFGVPSNLFIIGTMNTADRSVEALDSALRRRFNFIEIPPDYNVIKTAGKPQKDNMDIDLAELLKKMNMRIEKLLDKDHLIGHSYFLSVDSLSSLKSVFQDQIIPLLQEYFYGEYGKIGLVLSKDFFIDQGKQHNDNIFAEFDDSYDVEGLQERSVYKLKNLDHITDSEFETAINSLLNIQNA